MARFRINVRGFAAVTAAVVLLGAMGGGAADGATRTPAKPAKKPAKAASKTAKRKTAKTPPTTEAATGTPEAATSTTPVTTLAPSFVPTLTWRTGCGSSVECGELTVPLDYKNPTDGRTAQLRIARRKARSQSQRIGLVLLNPGGPGGSAVDMVRNADSYASIPTTIRDRFDVVGVDPRAIDGSVPIVCPSAGPVAGDATDRAAAFAVACGKYNGDTLLYVGTDSSAEDLDMARVALGEDSISYIGFSYGTYLGGLYAQAHPDRVRAMILDAAVDPTRFGVDYSGDSMKAKERVLTSFFDWCAKQRVCSLRIDGKDPRTRFEEMLLIASRTGIGGQKIDRTSLEALTSELLEEDWTLLDFALGELSRGRTAIFGDLNSYFRSDNVSRSEDGGFEAVGCRDGLYASANQDGMSPADRLSRYQASAPHFLAFAEFWANEAVCLKWPVPVRPRAPLTTTAGARIVVVNNTLDFRTPIEWGTSLSAQLGAQLVTVDTYGHTAVFDPPQCPRDVATTWLVELRLTTQRC